MNDADHYRQRWPSWLPREAFSVGGVPVMPLDVLRAHAGMTATLRAESEGRVVVIKTYRGLFRGAAGVWRAQHGARLLLRNNLPAPECLAVGRLDGMRAYGLLLEHLERDGDELRVSPTEAWHLAQVVMPMLARLHEAGLVQMDPTPQNFFPARGRYYFIDPDRVRRPPGLLARHYYINNLVVLFTHRPPVLSGHLVEALGLYADHRSGLDRRALMRAVIRQVQTCRRAVVLKRIRRSLAGHKFYVRQRLADGEIVVDTRRLPGQPRPMGAEGLWAYLLEHADQNYRFDPCSRPREAWRLARAASGLDLACPEPVAMRPGMAVWRLPEGMRPLAWDEQNLPAGFALHAAASLQALNETGLQVDPGADWCTDAQGRLGFDDPGCLRWEPDSAARAASIAQVLDVLPPPVGGAYAQLCAEREAVLR